MMNQRRRYELGPDEIRVAETAFEAALQSLRDRASFLGAHSTRAVMASFIINKVLTGERDVGLLHTGALERVQGSAT